MRSTYGPRLRLLNGRRLLFSGVAGIHGRDGLPRFLPLETAVRGADATSWCLNTWRTMASGAAFPKWAMPQVGSSLPSSCRVNSAPRNPWRPPLPHVRDPGHLWSRCRVLIGSWGSVSPAVTCNPSIGFAACLWTNASCSDSVILSVMVLIIVSGSKSLTSPGVLMHACRPTTRPAVIVLTQPGLIT